MEFTGKILNIVNNAITGQMQVTLSVDQREQMVSEYDSLKDEHLSIKIAKHTKKRSLDANAMLWSCLSMMAIALGTDKWDVYLKMLCRYGKFTYISIKPEALESFKAMWRECEVVGEQNGMIDVLCYFGSSTYNSKEFSVLLDGVISEMKEMGLTPPPTEEMRRAIERLEVNRAKG